MQIHALDLTLARTFARTLAMAAMLLLAACGSGTTSSVAGGHCGAVADCPTGTACICPNGARSCGNTATCTELCTDTPGGTPTCPNGGACVAEGVACCEGVSNCTLDCMRASVCMP